MSFAVAAKCKIVGALIVLYQQVWALLSVPLPVEEETGHVFPSVAETNAGIKLAEQREVWEMLIAASVVWQRESFHARVLVDIADDFFAILYYYILFQVSVSWVDFWVKGYSSSSVVLKYNLPKDCCFSTKQEIQVFLFVFR